MQGHCRDGTAHVEDFAEDIKAGGANLQVLGSRAALGTSQTGLQGALEEKLLVKSNSLLFWQ